MPRSTSTSAATRARIVLAAERLFSERGLDAVSLREVGTAAGQRNSAAVQYHFGNKEALLKAIFEYRMQAINDSRLRLLEHIRTAGLSTDLRSLVGAFVFPLVTETADGDSHYARFLAQLLSDPTRRSGFDWDSASSLRVAWVAIRTALDEFPRDTVDERMTMLHHLVLHTVADHEGSEITTPPGTPPMWAVRLVDAAVGLLTAPQSVC